MSGHTRHPDTEDLADFLAGLVSGTRGSAIAAHVARCQACAAIGEQINAVSAELAAAPALSLPRHVERRITAALLVEAAAKDAAARQAERAIPDRQRHRRARLWSLRVTIFPRALTVPLGAVVTVAVCLLLVAVGYILSAPFSPSPHPAARAAPGGPAAVSGELAVPRWRHDTLRTRGGTTVAFVVTMSGTDYQAATLRFQIRQEVQARASTARVVPAPVRTGLGAQSTAPRGSTSRGSAPVSPGRAGADDVAPSALLIGCVMHLTDDQEPAMVDRAAYESRPVYVIAVADHAWVVSLNCTAAHPSVIKSIALSPAA